MLPTTRMNTRTALLLLVAHLCWSATAAPTTPSNLKVVVLNSKPFSFLDLESAHSDDDAEYSGILIDLFKELAGRLNISYDFYEVPDGKYGYQDENGQWHGLVGELVNGKADVAVAPLTITSDRAKVVRFGRPIVPAGIVPIIKRPPAGQPLPFNTVEELVSKTDLLYGAVKDGATYQFFYNAPNDSVFAFLGQQMNARSDEVMARSYEEGVKRVREGGYVFFGEQYSLELLASRAPCNLMVIGGSSITMRHYAFAFRKEAVDIVDQFDQLLIEQEWDVNRVIKKYWEPQCSKPSICICDKRTRDALTGQPTKPDAEENVKGGHEEDDDESKEEEDRKEDKTGNEEKATANTEQGQKAVKAEPAAEAQPEPEPSAVKDDAAMSTNSTAASKQSNKQGNSTEPLAVPEDGADEGAAEGAGEGEKDASNTTSEVMGADVKNETNAEL